MATEAHSIEGTPRKRSKGWTESEEVALITLVLEREELLFGELKGCWGKSIHRKRVEAWEEIAAQLNTRYMDAKREGQEAKKKFFNLEQRAKSKIDAIKGSRYRTGGGPAPLQLNAADEALTQSLEEALIIPETTGTDCDQASSSEQVPTSTPQKKTGDFTTAGPLQFKSLETEIESHRRDAERIIDLAVNGQAKGQAYNRLAEFVDKFGSRISGSRNLENAIDYMLEKLQEDDLENVHGESAMVPHWVRGEESATLLEPRTLALSILGLGGSIATPPQGITAEVIVVKTFDELKQRAVEAKDKIVVYNQDYEGYGASVKYRRQGAVEAAKVGAVASLIRSVTPLSIDSPHTGWQDYSNDVTKIPTACITVEIAEMLHRMSLRGDKIVIKLKMEAQNLPMVKSRNTVAEIRGSTKPDEVVIVSGHLDSWDVGQGAMDDGGGAFISWQALSLIRQLGLRPKRTLRMVMWTGEEEGKWGAKEYFKQHRDELSKQDLLMESDEGTFRPKGIQFSGNKAATRIMKHVARLLSPINMTKLFSDASVTDISYWSDIGIPVGSIENDNDKYFYFHHSNGDMMTVENSDDLDLCSAVWAVTAYVVADLEDMLPRDTFISFLQV